MLQESGARRRALVALLLIPGGLRSGMVSPVRRRMWMPVALFMPAGSLRSFAMA